MKLTDLLARLSKVKGVSIAERIALPDGTETIMIVADLPEFPFGVGKKVSYPLVISPGQTDVPRSEIDALLRRVWHLSLDWFNQPSEP